MSSNAEFIRAHLQRQQERKGFPFSVFRAPSEGATPLPRRVDVAREVIAHLTGLSEARLDELKPREWQFEKDWRVLGGAVYYSRASLALFVGVLSTSGEKDAAGKLLHFLAEGAEERRGLPTIKAAADEIEHALTPGTTRVDLKPAFRRQAAPWWKKGAME